MILVSVNTRIMFSVWLKRQLPLPMRMWIFPNLIMMKTATSMHFLWFIPDLVLPSLDVKKELDISGHINGRYLKQSMTVLR